MINFLMRRNKVHSFLFTLHNTLLDTWSSEISHLDTTVFFGSLFKTFTRLDILCNPWQARDNVLPEGAIEKSRNSSPYSNAFPW